MATPYNIEVDAGLRGLLGYQHDKIAAAKVSDLVQKDLEEHHVYFLAKGFHNHMVHHLLTLYGTGASPESMQSAFDVDSHMQKPALNLHDGVVEELKADYAAAQKYLGKPEYYPDFLRFFQGEVEGKGWKNTLLEYLWSGDKRAEDLFKRSWASFAHSMIQLMYGIEWEQPAIIAEGLAQAAIHDDYVGSFLTGVEAAAAANPPTTPLSLPEALERVREDEKFVQSVRDGNPNAMLDGVENICPPEGIFYLSKIKVDSGNLEEAVAENVHTAAYLASASVFHPPYVPRFDFFIVHHLTLTPLLLLLQSADWVPAKVTHRILEWKGRFDVLSYVVRWCPPLSVDDITSYTPQDSTLVNTTEELLPRFHASADDGHVIKVARALVLAQKVTQKYKGRPWIRIRDDATWLRAAYLLLDSTKLVHAGFPWVRTAGWDEAWKESGYPVGVL